VAEPKPATEAPPEPLNLAPVARAAIVVGLALVVISGFLEWAGRNFPRSFSGLDVPAKFLIDSKANLDGGGLPLGVLVILIGAVGLVAALAPIPRRDVLVWASGAAGVVIALLYLYQLNEFMDRFNRVFGPGGFGARNTVGFGAALCGFGAVLTLAGAALGLYVRRGAGDR
jgi:hypothetical protein